MGIESRMRILINMLKDASEAYYTGKYESPLSDLQYDAYFAELVELEVTAGYRLPDSPTMRVGYSEDDDKIKHYAPILSLKHTKSLDDLLYFLGEEEGLLSWKIDGISIVLYYDNGQLNKAVTRGDGMVGKDITKNALAMSNVLKKIDSKGTVIIRGEGCISYSEFNKLRDSKPDNKIYKNPRNLAAGLLNTREPSSLLRYLSFIAHSAILLDIPENNIKYDIKEDILSYLDLLGFHVVPYVKVYNYTLKHELDGFTNYAERFDYPVDGLVLTMNDIGYGRSLGSTSRYPRDTMAFKWEDICVKTKVRSVKWSVSRNGLITPIVSFDPVELDGTTVRQANLHSLKIFENLQLGRGDIIEVYKANKIVPEVKENYTRSDMETYPKYCPICDHPTGVVESLKTRKLICPECAKDIAEIS